MALSDTAVIVLIVEDEMVLRMQAVDIVEDTGFVPVEAVSADEAIQILESRDDISLLFTDIQMPGTMDGLMLAHAVHVRWPHIKIILVSVLISASDRPTFPFRADLNLSLKIMLLVGCWHKKAGQAFFETWVDPTRKSTPPRPQKRAGAVALIKLQATSEPLHLLPLGSPRGSNNVIHLTSTQFSNST